MRYAFSALFSTGVMMPIGFEYGFRGRLNVVKTTPSDWERPTWDLVDFVTRINRLKSSHRVFNEEGPIEALDCGNRALVAFYKSSRAGGERALVILNKDRQRAQPCDLSRLAHVFSGARSVEDVSPEVRFTSAGGNLMNQIESSGIRVLSARFS